MTIVQNNSIKNDVQTVLIRNFSEPLIIDNSDRNEVRHILNLSKIHLTIFTLKKETAIRKVTEGIILSIMLRITKIILPS